jgi:phage tail tape-measure protein
MGVGTALGTAAGGTTTGSLTGSVIGSILGGIAGSFIPGGTLIGASIGGSLGGYFGGLATTPANDMYSAGYGSRTLVTPKGAFALNNADDIIAGTNLFPKGSLRAGSDNSDLVRKVDNLITALSNATTTINVGGNMQTVPRLQLVGVYSRNEVR